MTITKSLPQLFKGSNRLVNLLLYYFQALSMKMFFIKTFENGPHQEGIGLFSYFPKLGSYLKNLQMASIYIKLNHKSISTQYYYHLLHYQQRAIIFVIFHQIACSIWYFLT